MENISALGKYLVDKLVEGIAFEFATTTIIVSLV